MEIEPIPVKTVWSRADWVLVLLTLIPLTVALLVCDLAYDLFTRLRRSLKRGV